MLIVNTLQPSTANVFLSLFYKTEIQGYGAAAFSDLSQLRAVTLVVVVVACQKFWLLQI